MGVPLVFVSGFLSNWYTRSDKQGWPEPLAWSFLSQVQAGAQRD